MTRLTKVELRRLFSRRLTLIAVLGALAITGLMLFGTFEEAKPLSRAELTSQRAQFDQAVKEFEATGEQQVADCLAQQAEALKTDPKADFGCSQLKPNLQNYFKPQAKLPR